MNSFSRCAAIAALACMVSSAFADGVLVNGNFETGDLAGWTEMRPNYPGADSTVFDDTIADDPMLSPYAATFACGWTRGNGEYAWTGHDSTQPSNAISQTITNAPGTYPVTVSAAFYCHHDRRGEPEDNWGCGLWLQIFVDDDIYPVWRHDLWPREAESFWKYHRSLDNEIYDGAPNQITTSTGMIRFEVAWISKWTIDRDICAIDNVQLELGPPGDDPYDDPLQPAPVYLPPIVIGPTDPGFAARTFLEPAHYPVGLRPICLATDDFNGDGLPDIAAANYRSHSISLLPSEGGGRFGPAIDIACGHNPRWLSATDVDLDHQTDIVVSCRGDAKVQTFLGGGDGSFGAPIDTPGPENPWRIAVGQIDSDSYPDLIVPNDSEDNAHVSTGNGDGTFTPHSILAGDDMTATALIADFDRDRDNDVLLMAWWDSDVRAYRNDGSGGFAQRTTIDLPWQSESGVVADFNGDGWLDFCGGGAHSAAARFYLGNGDVTFTRGPTDFKPRVPTDLCTGFWDEDGLPDVASSNFDVNEFALWRVLNVWQEEVSPAENIGNYAAGRQPRAIVSDDFNDDGVPDIAVAAGDDNEVLVFLGLPGGLWTGSTTHSPGGFFPESQAGAAGDFDGDGDLDVAVGLSAWGSPLLHLLRNDGRPPLVYVEDNEYDTSYTPTAIAAGDVDHDNDDDVFVAARFIRRYRSNGDMTFTYLGYLRAGTEPVDLELVDLNEDTHLDLVCANSGTDEVSVFLGDGAGSFGTEIVTVVGDRPEALCVANLDATGAPDLAVANAGDDSVMVCWGQGDGTFTAGGVIAVGDEPVDIDCGYVDEDEHLDIVTADRGSSTISILYGKGDGAFWPVVQETLHAAPSCLEVADFSGDGRADIAVGLPGATSVVLLVSRPDGTFDREFFTAVGEPRRLSGSPIWGRGQPDLLCIPGGVTRIQVFANAMLLEGRFTDIRRESETGVTVEWVGSTNAVHVVESAPENAGPWTPRHTAPSPAALNTWTDDEAPSQNQRAYRVRLER